MFTKIFPMTAFKNFDMFVSNFKRGQHTEVYMNLGQVKKFV